MVIKVEVQAPGQVRQARQVHQDQVYQDHQDQVRRLE